MKKTILFFFLVIVALNASAQQTISYSYNNAGNRIGRYVIMLRASSQHADSLIQQKEEEGISRSLLTCKITVYPNPTQGEVHVTISNGEEDAISDIFVHSEAGQLLMTLKATGNSTVPIDLSPFTSGIYLINFQQADNRSYYKIIKQ